MSEALLSTEHLRKCFGGVVATDTLSLEVVPGEIHAVIGPNGAGKTTLVNLLSGLLKPDAGEIQFEGRPLTRLPAAGRVNRGLARSFQITSVLRDFIAADNVALTIQARQVHSFRFWKPALTDPALRQPAATYLDQVGLADRADIVAGHLAHGEQRQLEIAMVLTTCSRSISSLTHAGKGAISALVGSDNYQSSTLRMKLNRRDYDGAAGEFWKWRRAGDKILARLVRRRAAEKALFLN